MKKLFWTNKSATLRLTFIFIGLTILSFASIVMTNSSQAANLKAISVVSDNTIKLGDLFDNLHDNADYVIGAAPQPGKDITLNARTLYRIAVALDLKWRPKTMAEQVIIRREASVVPFNKIKASLRNALKEKGISNSFKVKLNQGKPSMTLPQGTNDSVEISTLNFDHNSNIFNATLVAPSKDNPLKTLMVSGMIERQLSVPVLRNTLQNGDIIGKNDIKMIDISEHDLQSNMIMKADDLVGLTPRRVTYAGKYLQKGAFEKPQLVERGEPVFITYKSGAITLTAKGKALQSGAKGDLVRVTNINSSRTIDATVNGTNQVIAN